mgnify:CR=1
MEIEASSYHQEAFHTFVVDNKALASRTGESEVPVWS